MPTAATIEMAFSESGGGGSEESWLGVALSVGLRSAVFLLVALICVRGLY